MPRVSLSIEFYCYMLEVTRKNQILLSYLNDEKDTFTNYIMIWYKEGIHNYSYLNHGTLVIVMLEGAKVDFAHL